MAAGELSRLLDQDGDGAIGDEAAERTERAEIARAQAESDAAEGERRLQVARQQFAEYAQSKATEAAGLGSMIRDLLAACDGVGSAELTKKVLEIKETMDAAAAVNPSDPHPLTVDNLCNHGALLERVRHDVDAAEALYERALAVDPQHRSVLFN